MNDFEKTKNLIHEIYQFNAVGANCHIVLDDGNIEDEHIQWCLDVAVVENYHKSTPSQLETEKQVLKLLLSMTMEERSDLLDVELELDL